MKNEFSNLTREELEKECVKLQKENLKLQKEVEGQDILLGNLLNCGTDDLKKLQEWDEILDNHNLDFSDVLDCLNEIYLNKDFELNYNILIMGIFEILLNEFQDDFNLKLEQGKDFNVDLNYYCSDIYFVDEKMQDKFDKWL